MHGITYRSSAECPIAVHSTQQSAAVTRNVVLYRTYIMLMKFQCGMDGLTAVAARGVELAA